MGRHGLIPVTEDAVPKKVLDEVWALWRISGTKNFTRRSRLGCLSQLSAAVGGGSFLLSPRHDRFEMRLTPAGAAQDR